MARPKKNPADIKSATLSLRLDPRVRFALDFATRVTGHSLTRVVEIAILKYADQIKGKDQTWNSFWHISEGVRELGFLFLAKSFVTYEEELLKDFVGRHEQFFTYNVSLDTLASLERPLGERLDPDKIEVLWPNIQKYLDLWEKTKSTDHWAAGKAMAKDLKAAGLKAPEWPLLAPEDDPEFEITEDSEDEPDDETSS